MSIESQFPNAEAIKLALDMGMDKMLAWNVGEMAAILEESAKPVA